MLSGNQAFIWATQSAGKTFHCMSLAFVLFIWAHFTEDSWLKIHPVSCTLIPGEGMRMSE